MQLASSGVRGLFGRRAVTTNVSGGSHGANRTIHTPAIPRPQVSVASGRSAAQNVISHTRSLLSSFIGHLTTPGTLRSSQPSAAARSLHTGSPHGRTIQQGLSLPARYALGRPLHAPYLPRAPAVPANVTHVGLGIARNFSTARPIFQDLVQNVPVAGRAFLEADWEVQMSKERQKRRAERAQKKAVRQTRKEMLKAKDAEMSWAVVPESTTEETRADELEHYFPAAEPNVVTYLLVPLAPTPTSRVPLPPNPSSSSAHPLLPYALIASLHNSHDSHALRVSSLFARLDHARVFDDPRVFCEARGDPTGLCTVLEVRFEGWEEAKVRSVIGEAGTGWCIMEEVWKDKEQAEREEMEDVLEKMSDIDGSLSGVEELSVSSVLSDGGGTRYDTGMARIDIDPATSFVLPTLDFSASFPVHSADIRRTDSPYDYDWSTTSAPAPSPASPAFSRSVSAIDIQSWADPTVSSPISDLAFHNSWTTMEREIYDSDVFSDSFSDVSSLSSSSSVFDSPSFSPPSMSRRSSGELSESWIGFSSQFANRVGEVQGPREDLF